MDLESKFDKFLDKYEANQEKLEDRLDSIEKILERNTVIVDEHQKRSLALENEMKITKIRISRLEKFKIRVLMIPVVVSALAACVYFFDKIGILKKLF